MPFLVIAVLCTFSVTSHNSICMKRLRSWHWRKLSKSQRCIFSAEWLQSTCSNMNQYSSGHIYKKFKGKERCLYQFYQSFWESFVFMQIHCAIRKSLEMLAISSDLFSLPFILLCYLTSWSECLTRLVCSWLRARRQGSLSGLDSNFLGFYSCKTPN